MTDSVIKEHYNSPIFLLVLSMLIICPHHSCILATNGVYSSKNHISKAETKGKERQQAVFFYFLAANYLLNKTPVKFFLGYFGWNWAT